MRGSPFECVPALRMRSPEYTTISRDLQSRDPCRRRALEGSPDYSAERVVRWRHDYTVPASSVAWAVDGDPA
jgi:hypothetical protein